MKFIYTEHANLRISQRGLSEKRIENTILRPDKILPSFKGRSIAQKDFGTKTLEVVYRKDNGEVIIITAYWLKEAR